MTDALDPAVPAGWYPDPWGASAQRWWDGTSWTESLRSDTEPDAGGADPSIEPVFQPTVTRSTFEPPTGTALPSRRALREQAAQAESEQEPEPMVLAQTLVASEEAPEEAPPIDAPISLAPPLDVPPAVANPLPAFTQAPEFTPEPVSALPPPVFSDPDPTPVVAEPTPVAQPEPAAVEVPPVVEVAAAPAPAATATSADDDWAASLSNWDDVDSTTAPPDALPIFGDAPPISYSQRATRYQPIHGRTSPVWLIVFMPVLHAGAVMGSLFLFPGIVDFADPAGSLAGMPGLLALRDWLLFAVLPLAFVFFVFTLIMGFQDRARLRLLGHDHTASPWWILLHPLAYLIARSVRVRQCTGRRGSGPLTTYLCLYIAPGIALGVATAVISALDGAIPT